MEVPIWKIWPQLTFLRYRRDAIAAMDFFSVPTITGRVLYCCCCFVKAMIVDAFIGCYHRGSARRPGILGSIRRPHF